MTSPVKLIAIRIHDDPSPGNSARYLLLTNSHVNWSDTRKPYSQILPFSNERDIGPKSWYPKGLEVRVAIAAATGIGDGRSA